MRAGGFGSAGGFARRAARDGRAVRGGRAQMVLAPPAEAMDAIGAMREAASSALLLGGAGGTGGEGGAWGSAALGALTR